MRVRIVAGVLGLLLALAACASEERQWMKVNEKYTTEEFRRDYQECSRGPRLDETCMRARGWVDVRPGRAEKAPEPERAGVAPKGR